MESGAKLSGTEPLSSEFDSTRVDKPVTVYSYVGTLADDLGKDGDFYVEEMTNVLYGPKADGVWPEVGISAAGLCKRSWIGVSRARMSKAQQESQRGGPIVWLQRFLRSIRLSGRRAAAR